MPAGIGYGRRALSALRGAGRRFGRAKTTNGLDTLAKARQGMGGGRGLGYMGGGPLAGAGRGTMDTFLSVNRTFDPATGRVGGPRRNAAAAARVTQGPRRGSGRSSMAMLGVAGAVAAGGAVGGMGYMAGQSRQRGPRQSIYGGGMTY